mgnify:FL=1
MHLTTLLSGIQTVIECAKENGRSIAGVDICGEADAEAAHETESNDFANEKLLEVFDGLFGKRNGLDIKIPPPQAIFNEV